jgi:hypothetical protein
MYVPVPQSIQQHLHTSKSHIKYSNISSISQLEFPLCMVNGVILKY